jgi:ABC-2 type transport system permease protein
MTTQAKATLGRDQILAARQGLRPVRERRRLGGFGNMLRKELGQWWGTRTWLIQLVIWLVILNGISTIVTVEALRSSESGPAGALPEILSTFFGVGIFALAIGTATTAQSAIVGEKQSGTAAWVLSKPASRSAFVLAKAVGYAVNLGVAAVLIPSVIFFLELRLLFSLPVGLAGFAAGVGLVWLSQLFYLMLALMLGTLFNGRGPIIAIPITVLMIGFAFQGLIPMPIMLVSPWPLEQIASGLATGTPLPAEWPMPVIATTVYSVGMLAVALIRFAREEF